MAKYKVEMSGYSFENTIQYTHDETMKLINQYHQTKDNKIKEELIFSNLKLVLSLVQKYQQRVNNLDDLFQVGVIGLIKAIDHFDTSLDVRFSTYAVPLILGEMKRYMRENSSLRIPRTLRDLAYKAMLKNEEYQRKYQKDATTQELSRLLEVDESFLVEALSSTCTVASLSQEVQNDGQSSIDLESQIPDKKGNKIDIHTELDLKNAMNLLNEKELQIIQHRYFQRYTQIKLVKVLFISQAQVSRIEKQALQHLKKYMQAN